MGSHYKIRTEKTGHYYLHGKLSSATRLVWVCLHGYGQLARYFVPKFEFLDPAEHFVVVPEGLNRFYTEGSERRPVASWMTSEDRLDEIADYVTYLETLRHKVGWDKPSHVKVIYVGFSQGVTTLIRWMANIHPRADTLILWAGGLPEDTLLEPHRDYFSQIKTYYLLGRQDPYFQEERLNANEALLQAAGIRPEIIRYAGGHKLEAETLKQWLDQWMITSR